MDDFHANHALSISIVVVIIVFIVIRLLVVLFQSSNF